MDNNIHVSSMSCYFYNNYNQYCLIFLSISSSFPIPLTVHTGDRTLAEPIRTWPTGTIIRTRECPNSMCPWRHHCWVIKCIMSWVWITSALRMSQSCQYSTMWDSWGDPYGFKTWPPPCMWCGTLFLVALCFTHLVPDASMTVCITHISSNMSTESVNNNIYNKSTRDILVTQHQAKWEF